MAEEFLTEAFMVLKAQRRAEDALQDAFCRLWKKRVNPSSLKQAIALLLTTRRNIEIDEFRKNQRHPFVSMEDRQFSYEEGGALEREALFRKVEESVEKDLSQLQSQIVRMHEYEGKSFEEIARKLNMQPAAVRMHVSRARKALRDKFNKGNEAD